MYMYHYRNTCTKKRLTLVRMALQCTYFTKEDWRAGVKGGKWGGGREERGRRKGERRKEGKKDDAAILYNVPSNAHLVKPSFWGCSLLLSSWILLFECPTDVSGVKRGEGERWGERGRERGKRGGRTKRKGDRGKGRGEDGWKIRKKRRDLSLPPINTTSYMYTCGLRSGMTYSSVHN